MSDLLFWDDDVEGDIRFLSVGSISALKISGDFPLDSTVLYTTESTLPPGLTLELDGRITGIVTQIEGYEIAGITIIDGGDTTFDNNTTGYDHKFTFLVKAQGTTSKQVVQQNFIIQINTTIYTNIIAKLFLPVTQRSLWNDFINNEKIFIKNYIYKPLDNRFGIQKDLSMLIYAGIEKDQAEKYVSAMGLHHKRKRFQFGNIATAKSVDPVTLQVEYEVVYVVVNDPLEQGSKILPDKIKSYPKPDQRINADNNSNIFWSRKIDELEESIPFSVRPDPRIYADETSYLISDPDSSIYYINSLSHWRNQLESWKDDNGNGFLIETNCLPRWMRTIQDQSGEYKELGYIPAVVLCYCEPGMSGKIVKNINNYMNTNKFVFNQFDFIVDRYVVIDRYIYFRSEPNVI